MKVVILAGGFGTRLSEYTASIPKPMVEIGDRPILWHIMEWYASFGYTDFIIALGYRGDVIKKFFYDYALLGSDFEINLQDGEIKTLGILRRPWRVSLVFTGANTMTGGRLNRLREYIGDAPFLLTYGDGVSDVPIDELVSFHKSHGKLVTVTAVRPSARFGEILIDEDIVVSFQEKPQTGAGWINGGFFVIEPSFLDRIKNDETVLEKEPLESLANDAQLRAYRHSGFWQCMDTKRDRDLLETIWSDGNAPWKPKTI